MIVCEELAVIKECPEDASKCVKVCEVRFRVAFRGPWLFGLHKIARRWVAKRYERLVKETSQMEVNRIEFEEDGRIRAGNARRDEVLAKFGKD